MKHFFFCVSSLHLLRGIMRNHVAMRSCLAYYDRMIPPSPTADAAALAISAHYRALGALGGRVSSPAKTRAARAAARKRWGHPEPVQKPLSPSRLKDGAWYQGLGRNGSLAMWDGIQKCFWITIVTDVPDPSTYPAGSSRIVRLKQEGHASHEGGTFSPMNLVRQNF